MDKLVPLLLLMSLMTAPLASSADDEMDDELMRSVEDTNKSLASDLAQADPQASVADARDLQAMFQKVNEFFVARHDAQDGVNLSKKSLDLTAEILKQIAAKDFSAASVTATDLSRTCKSCHNLYKKS